MATKTRISKKNVGDTVEFIGHDGQYIISKAAKVARGITTLEYQFRGETYTTYLEVNSPRIVAVHNLKA